MALAAPRRHTMDMHACCPASSHLHRAGAHAPCCCAGRRHLCVWRTQPGAGLASAVCIEQMRPRRAYLTATLDSVRACVCVYVLLECSLLACPPLLDMHPA
eukprot:156835-Chlamydomonas_euryale.AAC.2